MKSLVLGVLLVAACAGRQPIAVEPGTAPSESDHARNERVLEATAPAGAARTPEVRALAPGDAMTQSHVRRVFRKSWGGYTLTTTFTRETRSVVTGDGEESETVETYVATTTRKRPRAPATGDTGGR